MKKRNSMRRFIFSILLVVTVSPVAANEDEALVRDVLARFEKGWEEKDTDILKGCFHEFTDQQKKLYDVLFEQVKSVSIDFDIEVVNVQSIFCNANTKMTKSITYNAAGSTPTVKKEAVNYIFMKNGRKWAIIGTVYPDRKQEAVRITDTNLPLINKQLEKIPQDDRLSLLKDYAALGSENRRIHVTREPKTFYLKITLNTVQEPGVAGNKVLWTLERTFKSFVDVPQLVIDKMEMDTDYYLHASSIAGNGEVIGVQILKVRRAQ